MSFRDVTSFLERAVPLDYAAAVTNATAGWPSYLNLYGMDESHSSLQREAFSDLNFANMPPGHTFADVDPMSRSLAAAGAQILGSEELRLRGGNGALGNFVRGVRELPERRIAADRSHGRHVAVRLGPHARGDARN